MSEQLTLDVVGPTRTVDARDVLPGAPTLRELGDLLFGVHVDLSDGTAGRVCGVGLQPPGRFEDGPPMVHVDIGTRKVVAYLPDLATCDVEVPA